MVDGGELLAIVEEPVGDPQLIIVAADDICAGDSVGQCSVGGLGVCDGLEGLAVVEEAAPLCASGLADAHDLVCINSHQITFCARIWRIDCGEGCSVEEKSMGFRRSIVVVSDDDLP